MKKYNKIISIALLIILLLCCIMQINKQDTIQAAEVSKKPAMKVYELNGSSSFNFEDTSPQSGTLCYGDSHAVEFEVVGNINGDTVFRNTQAYGTVGLLQFKYDYTSNKLKENNEDNWVITDSESTSMGSTSLNEKIGKGVLVVEKSAYPTRWNKELEIHNVFNQSSSTIYTTLQNDIETGMYYRILVGYEVRHKTGEEKHWTFWPFSYEMVPTYEYKSIVEESIFYVCYNERVVKVKDYNPMYRIDGEVIDDGGSVKYGFKIEKGDSTNLTKVQIPSGDIISASNGQVFLQKGIYTVTETTKIGVKFTSTITVELGCAIYEAGSVIYNCDDNSGYNFPNDDKINQESYSTLTIASYSTGTSNAAIKKGSLNGIESYGVSGTNVSFLLSLNKNNLPVGYKVSNDSWGKYEHEKVNNILVGEVGTGAILLQKSKDGINWSICDSKLDSGKYENGLYTTDYEKEFGTTSVNIYNPSGDDIINGLYYRISYAYEITDLEVYKNIVEVHTFYLCSDNIDSVTFHNLSLEGKIEDSFGEEDQTFVEISKLSETLIDGSFTTTGFVIDTSLNPTVNISIKRDFNDYEVPENKEIKEDGRYDIRLTTQLGTEKTITIFVFTGDSKELYDKYFTNPFITIDSKRIFSKGDYPVYEGGLTKYELKAIDNKLPCLWGTIKNNTTGEIININQYISSISATILSAGNYTVELNTNETYITDNKSGDNYKYVFRFEVIEEGKAPGPQINKENLSLFNNNANPTNSYPIYYGVTYASAHKGYITLAFAEEKDAIDYAYNYAKGTVEIQPDGSYRYDGNLKIGQKVKYDSAWDLTDAIYYFANQAVEKLCFDISDPFTYATLSEDVINSTENLRTLELGKSVVIFANEDEKEKLISKLGLPIINSMKYSYVIPGGDETTEDGVNYFAFIKDSHGYDSASVKIIDSEGNTYEILYNESVESQLEAFDCKTGIITIEEATIYGDKTTYQAIYIAKNDITTELDLKYIINDKEYVEHVSKDNNDFSINVNGFYFANVIDQFDPYSLVIINNGTEKEYYCINELKDKVWTEANTYNIKIVNRLGYTYSFELVITSSYYALTFAGIGTDELAPVLYSDGDTIHLPTLTRYGYEFLGYKTQSGNIYSEEVTAILLKGVAVVEAAWKAKQFSMSLFIDNNIYQTSLVDFGETYTLPVLESTPNNKFVGWYDEENQIVTEVSVYEEKNLKFTAHYEALADNNEETQTPENSNDNKDTPIKNRNDSLTKILIGIGIIIVFTALLLLIYQSSFYKVAILIAGSLVAIITYLVLLFFTSLLWIFILLIALGASLVTSLIVRLIEFISDEI